MTTNRYRFHFPRPLPVTADRPPGAAVAAAPAAAAHIIRAGRAGPFAAAGLLASVVLSIEAP